MPSQTRFPSIVIRRVDIAFALAYVRHLAATNTPGFAGKTFVYGATAVSCLLAGLKSGELGPIKPQSSCEIIDEHGEIAVVVIAQRDEWIAILVAAQVSNVFFGLLARGWERGQHNRHLRRKRDVTQTLASIREEVEQAVGSAHSTPPAPPANQTSAGNHEQKN